VPPQSVEPSTPAFVAQISWNLMANNPIQWAFMSCISCLKHENQITDWKLLQEHSIRQRRLWIRCVSHAKLLLCVVNKDAEWTRHSQSQGRRNSNRAESLKTSEPSSAGEPDRSFEMIFELCVFFKNVKKRDE
jgi:hypothetical protein